MSLADEHPVTPAAPREPLRVRLTTDGARGQAPQQELHAAYAHNPAVAIAINRDRGPLPAADVCADLDVLVIDGHSYYQGRQIRPDILRRSYGGITAPVIILGCCWGADEEFTSAIGCCLGIPEAVLVASTGKTELDHARTLYPRVIDTVCRLGPHPRLLAPELQRLLQPAGGRGPRGWSAQLITRSSAPTGPATNPPAQGTPGSGKGPR